MKPLRQQFVVNIIYLGLSSIVILLYIGILLPYLDDMFTRSNSCCISAESTRIHIAGAVSSELMYRAMLLPELLVVCQMSVCI